MSKFLLGEIYLKTADSDLNGYLVVSNYNEKIGLVNLKHLNFDNSDYQSYFKDDLTNLENQDQNWYWTKMLFQFLDSIEQKQIKISEINNLDQAIENDEQDIIYLIDKNNLINENNIFYSRSIINDDLFELVSKLINKDKINNFLTLDLKTDLIDTQNWLLDLIFDNR